MVMLSHFVDKLQKGLSIFTHREHDLHDVELDQDLEVKTMVPDDVKAGHFSVFAIKGEEVKRFVIELSYLTDPAFVRLLEQAEEEYGFKQKGVLAVPCLPEELQKILREKKEKSDIAEVWTSRSAPIIKSY